MPRSPATGGVPREQPAGPPPTGRPGQQAPRQPPGRRQAAPAGGSRTPGERQEPALGWPPVCHRCWAAPVCARTGRPRQPGAGQRLARWTRRRGGRSRRRAAPARGVPPAPRCSPPPGRQHPGGAPPQMQMRQPRHASRAAFRWGAPGGGGPHAWDGGIRLLLSMEPPQHAMLHPLSSPPAACPAPRPGSPGAGRSWAMPCPPAGWQPGRSGAQPPGWRRRRTCWRSLAPNRTNKGRHQAGQRAQSARTGAQRQRHQPPCAAPARPPGRAP